jgi:hypothetical protein
MRAALLLFFLVGTLLAGCGRREADVAAIRTELNSAIKRRDIRDQVFSRKLEKWYLALGQTIKIDDPREHTSYIFGLSIATAPDAEIPGLLRQMPGITDRAGILAHYLKTANLTALPFEKTQWLQTPTTGRTRYRMFKTFLTEHQPIGRSESEIQAILGPATSQGPGGFGYYLGEDLSAFSIDSLWVGFSVKDGKVTEFRFHED